jgi:DNA-directed RNA polymerase specialized sigma24 family protein
MPSSTERPIIPKNYDELREQYERLIYKVLLKYNKVERNFEDLCQDVWRRLLQADLLKRFEEKVQLQAPKVLTAVQACDFLGVSWDQWCAAMWAYHKGQPRKNKDGTRKRCRRKKGRWMPTPINLAEFQAQGLAGYATKTALFAFEDVIQLTLEKRTKSGKTRRAFRVMGRDVRNGVVVGESRPEGFLKFPKARVTRLQFQNYLIMSVLNHYANFCRTQDRRHKERPYTPPAHMEGEGIIWESTLPDKKPSADTMVALGEARRMLSETLHECADGVKCCKPIKEHESEVFTSLENGATLMQALKSSSLPPKVCKSVVDTVRPLAREFS